MWRAGGEQKRTCHHSMRRWAASCSAVPHSSCPRSRSSSTHPPSRPAPPLQTHHHNLNRHPAPLPGPAPQMATRSPGPTSPSSHECQAVGRMSDSSTWWRVGKGQGQAQGPRDDCRARVPCSWAWHATHWRHLVAAQGLQCIGASPVLLARLTTWSSSSELGTCGGWWQGNPSSRHACSRSSSTGLPLQAVLCCAVLC